MNFYKKHIALVLVLSLILLSCATVPLTGRKQLSLIPASQMLVTSFSQYDEFLQTHELSKNAEQTAMVKRVGTRIKGAVEAYLQEQGMSDRLQGFEWEFNLVKSDEANAWCMPGGKVVVYSGILPITQDEDGLAVVMGHEIAHAIANHGGERMSQALVTQMGGMALNKALENKPEQTRNLWMGAFGLGAQFGYLLPFSRTHEKEADHLGLIFMAIAGYNPEKAVEFWQRMSTMKEGTAPPEFMSTHPSDATRIREIQANLPEAMAYYKKYKQ